MRAFFAAPVSICVKESPSKMYSISSSNVQLNRLCSTTLSKDCPHIGQRTPVASDRSYDASTAASCLVSSCLLSPSSDSESFPVEPLFLKEDISTITRTIPVQSARNLFLKSRVRRGNQRALLSLTAVKHTLSASANEGEDKENTNVTNEEVKVNPNDKPGVKSSVTKEFKAESNVPFESKLPFRSCETDSNVLVSSTSSDKDLLKVILVEMPVGRTDLPSCIFQSSSCVEFATSPVLLFRGKCGKVPKTPSEIRLFDSGSKEFPHSCRRVSFSCGCCFAGIPNSCLVEACSNICHLLQLTSTSAEIWKGIYLSEKLNHGSNSSFLSKGKNLLEDRAKIVNWMSYVCSKLGFQSSVYFLAVNMFDLYIERSRKTFKSPDLPPIAASAFLQAANVIEVGNDGKLPTLREFVSAAPWLESTSQVLTIQLDMVKVIISPSWDLSHQSQSTNSTLTGKTPFDLLIMYLSEIKHSAKWSKVWTWLISSGNLIEVFHRCMSVSDLAYQRGLNLTTRGSCIIAATFVFILSRCLAPFKCGSFRDSFCLDLFHLNWCDEIMPHLQTVTGLYEASLLNTFPLCGDDMGGSAPTVTTFLRKLNPQQRIVEKLVRHQYRVFKSSLEVCPGVVS